MYFVYVLKSLKRNWFYTGLTANVSRRLREHNKGRVKSTKYNCPFKIIYRQSFSNRIFARDFEKYLKIHSNKEKLLKMLGYI